MDDLIRKLSEIRGEYNCFDKDEESYYHALSEAIRILSLLADGDTVSRQAAIELVTDTCYAIMSGCNSHYDSEVGEEVYDDIREVDAILKCNKEIGKALKGMPSAQPEIIQSKARWVLDFKTGRRRCSECYAFALRADDRQESLSDFCPVCGRKMEN